MNIPQNGEEILTQKRNIAKIKNEKKCDELQTKFNNGLRALFSKIYDKNYEDSRIKIQTKISPTDLKFLFNCDCYPINKTLVKQHGYNIEEDVDFEHYTFPERFINLHIENHLESKTIYVTEY